MGKVCMTRELIRLILILNVGITCVFCEDVTPTASTVNHVTLLSVSTTLDDSSVGHDVSESIKKTTVQEVKTSQFLDNDQSSQILVPAETTTAVLPSSSMVTGYGESSSSLAPDLTSSILDGLVSSSSDNKYLSTSMSETTVDAASVSLSVSTTEMLHTSDLLPDSVMGTSMQSSLSETLQSHSTSTISSITGTLQLSSSLLSVSMANSSILNSDSIINTLLPNTSSSMLDMTATEGLLESTTVLQLPSIISSKSTIDYMSSLLTTMNVTMVTVLSSSLLDYTTLIPSTTGDSVFPTAVSSLIYTAISNYSDSGISSNLLTSGTEIVTNSDSVISISDEFITDSVSLTSTFNIPVISSVTVNSNFPSSSQSDSKINSELSVFTTFSADLPTSLTEIDSVMSSFTDIVSSLPSSTSSVVSSVSGGLSSMDGQTVTEIVSNSEHTSTVVLSAASSSSIVVSESSSVTSSSDLVIAPTSTAMIPESSSTLPENAGPQHNKGGLSSGEKAALGICIPIVIVICLAGLIYYLYRRRYHVASWKLSDVVSYRPWSYRNASYYDDESSLIIPSLK